MEIKKITSDNIEELREVYNDFCKVAVDDYLFEVPPLPFDYFKENFSSGFIKGYFLTTDIPQAFLFYTDCLNQSIEITLMYAKEAENDYKIKTELVKNFLDEIKKEYKDKTISYPMLGVQNNFVMDITHLDFKLVGEMIVEVDFSKQISQMILDKCKTTQIESPYSLTCWKDDYLENAGKLFCEEFSKLNDAKFDPRFKTEEGTRNIIKEITNGYYGDFDPKYTTVLLENDIPVGYCFVNFTTDKLANIPLIAVSDKVSKRGFGAAILKNSVNLVKNNEQRISKMNATCDTENFPAIKMYRKIGFKEKTYYTHAYLNI